MTAIDPKMLWIISVRFTGSSADSRANSSNLKATKSLASSSMCRLSTSAGTFLL